MESKISRIIGELDRLQSELSEGWARIEAEAEEMRLAADDGVQRVMELLEGGE